MEKSIFRHIIYCIGVFFSSFLACEVRTLFVIWPGNAIIGGPDKLPGSSFLKRLFFMGLLKSSAY